MVKLSDRLEKIYALIEPGECVADIGTDHALLPAALYARGRSRALILSDARAGPLEKARANLDRLFPGAVFDLRLGDGLAPYARGEADVAVMAGMGGRRIADILSADAEKARSFGRYILQPRNAADSLRMRLAELGFAVTDEMLAAEGAFVWEILCASPVSGSSGTFARALLPSAQGAAAPCALRRAEALLTAGGAAAEISPLLFRKADPLLAPWLERKLRTADAVLACLLAAGAGKEDLLEKARARAALLRDLLDALRDLARTDA
ncbi:MAG: class I SAM-dependent methyltransferase [Clostridiales Family XIII bacterium]|jgi:tRNA (adenine22-N1)-methyltransferase|nr:class I SAM-dependent methyltransferase [Clostridiales Family XIII bacterium]